jgi:hypothetical protein
MKEMLTEVVVTYFRILKAATDTAAGSSVHGQGLLPTALEGLAAFAHLVNVDTVEDLLGELKLLLTASLARADGALPLDAALNCVRTAMRTLHGGTASSRFGRELSAVDEASFANGLFALLPKLSEYPAHADLAVECVDLVLLKRKE